MINKGLKIEIDININLIYILNAMNVGKIIFLGQLLPITDKIIFQFFSNV